MQPWRGAIPVTDQLLCQLYNTVPLAVVREQAAGGGGGRWRRHGGRRPGIRARHRRLGAPRLAARRHAGAHVDSYRFRRPPPRAERQAAAWVPGCSARRAVRPACTVQVSLCRYPLFVCQLFICFCSFETWGKRPLHDLLAPFN